MHDVRKARYRRPNQSPALPAPRSAGLAPMPACGAPPTLLSSNCIVAASKLQPNAALSIKRYPMTQSLLPSLARALLRTFCLPPALRRSVTPALLCVLVTLATGASAATINVWYGDNQVFGALGVPQKWVNILGNVTESTTVTSLSYSLNGGAPRALSMGPDTRRLQNAGDFNIDLSIDDLVNGANTVVITAQASGGTTTKTVTVQFHRNNVWPATYNVTWASVANLQDAVQVVDGRWTFSAAGARPLEWGYDRVLAVGDILWSDYEITIPVTIHAIDTSSKAYNSVSISPGLGIIMRWYGHEDWGTALKGPWQPVIGWEPLGANVWYDWGNNGLLFLAGEDGLYQADPANRKLVIGNTYYFKMRVETRPSGGGMYRAKMWQAGQSEPATWDMSGQEGSGDIPGGSLLLVAHHVDATFGNFSVVPLTTSDTTPPVISNVQNSIGTTTAGITWTTNEPTVGAVTYNYTDQHEFNGTALDPNTWTFVNPLGDGTVSVNNGKLSLSVPANTTHDIWTGVYSVPRVMRPAANKDLDLRAKFDSTVSQRYQQQGLVIEQDANNLLRVEVHHDGTTKKIFAASIVGGKATTRLSKSISGNAPFYVRVKRVGNQWIIYHSYNGTSWTNDKSFFMSLTVKATGVYVGNSSGPAHTAIVDWVSGSATAEVDSAGTGTQHSATLANLTPATTYQYWISATDTAGNSTVSPEYQFTTQSATSQGYTLSTSIVGSGTVSRSPDQATYDAGTVVQLTATAATGWTFAGWSGDLTGTTNPVSLTMDANRSVTATFTSTSTEKKTLTVTVNGSGTVSRDPDQAEYDVGQVVQLLATPASGSTFTGWSGDVTGTANPVSLTISNNHTVTAQFAAVGDTTAPIIADVQATPANTSATVSWTTNEPAVSAVTYKFDRRDEFEGSALDSNTWTFVNPLNDGTLSVSGGRVSLSVPAGTEHDVWTGTYTVPRIMRPTANQDLDLVAKFDSPLTQLYQQQGVLIEQDANNVIRVETHFEGSVTKFFVASVTGGTATTRLSKTIPSTVPVYLRVKRVGNQWTVSHSYDGTNWTTGVAFSLTLTVNTTGVFVGNAGGLAHTAVIDWVSESATADVASGGTGTQHNASLTGLTPATLYQYSITATDTAGNSSTSPGHQFTTLSEAPQSFTLSTAVTGSGSVSRTPDQTAYAAGTIVQLGATANAGWTFAGWSGDLSGTSNPASITMDANRSVTATFTTTPPPEKKTLTVSVEGSGTVSRQPDQTEYDIGQVVQLLATPSDGWAFSGWSGAVSGTANPTTITISDNHTVTAQFTPLGDLTPPVITNLQATADTTSAAVSWTTNEPATGTVAYNYAVQDEFDGTELNSSAWTFVNPLGDGTLVVNGGRLSLAVPAGTEHDVWTGKYTVPRIMRAAPNKDLDLRVKFDSAVSLRYQQQGLLIEQDSSNLLRVELFHDGSAIKLFAATITGGTATTRIFKSITISTPSFLRVVRTGSQWTVSYSSNGTNWTTGGTFTQALTVSAVGTHVGNSTAAHTAIVDWLSATGTSDTASVISGTQHTANLAGLTPASTYRYRVNATDTAGNTATAPEGLFATAAASAP